MSRRPGFRMYVDRKLGRTPAERWSNFFLRPFAAPTFTEFWRRWNPIYGYLLTYFVYRPTRRVAPRPLALMATFIFAGFVMHDLPAWVVARRILPPGGTIAFVLFGTGVLAGDKLRLDLSNRPVGLRVAANSAYLTTSVWMAVAIARRLAR